MVSASVKMLNRRVRTYVRMNARRKMENRDIKIELAIREGR